MDPVKSAGAKSPDFVPMRAPMGLKQNGVDVFEVDGLVGVPNGIEQRGDAEVSCSA
jgi:hypothetical protein